MKIALLGTRGIPANYGGFETFAEELSVRLAARGHEVKVYCRANFSETDAEVYRGVHRVLLPTVSHKYADTPAHTFISTLHLLLQDCDVALYCNGANAVFTYWPRVLGIPTALNVDGLERKRKKWNAMARAWYLLSERLSTLCPNVVISDAQVIERYYRERYGIDTRFIAYGAETSRVESTTILDELGLEPGRYFLYVSRMEPENNADLVVKAFEQTNCKEKLVMVGDAPYAEDYIRQVQNTSDERIMFPGAVYGAGYAELQSHCLAYVHATEVGGTHPALIEAMGRGCVVLYLETPENSEVAGRSGIAYSKNVQELAEGISSVALASRDEVNGLRQAAMADARARYDWERVVDRYEQLFIEMRSKSVT